MADQPQPPPLPESTVPPPATLFQKLKTHLSLGSTWPSELNGAMGDLGTYIPIVMTLSLSKGLDLGTTLIFTGLYNLITGALYGVPMPVQPMKAIAAVAISSKGDAFAVPEIMAAGICTGGVMLVLGLTGLMRFAYKVVPLAVVRGVQLAQGLAFALTAVRYVRNEQDLAKGKATGGGRGWGGLDGLVLALVCACFIVVVGGAGDHEKLLESDGLGTTSATGRTSRRRRARKILFSLPSALIVFTLGFILAIIRKPSVFEHFKLGPSNIRVVHITRRAWRDGFVKGAVPQIPLSVLNSVIAVCKLTSDLFPEKRGEVSTTSVSVTVGAMNVIGCWFGAMPCCHGAGGLAGQYRFGGRSGACVAMLGAAKAMLGIVVGSSIIEVLRMFPVGLLGVLLMFAGLELAMAARDMNTREDAFVVLVVAAVSMVGSSAALGFACGVVAHLLLRLRDRI
ncbi:Molybdate transporter 1 [Acorus gramineus]|uniref:Molybdate transporter 1 n=1 Tax=Acorus gramineus TaxID=55184 RepID=A0AAV9ALT9_ACOGR|nr:Molybdate transporter 1 [Acorus gramineus]